MIFDKLKCSIEKEEKQQFRSKNSVTVRTTSQPNIEKHLKRVIRFAKETRGFSQDFHPPLPPSLLLLYSLPSSFPLLYSSLLYSSILFSLPSSFPLLYLPSFSTLSLPSSFPLLYPPSFSIPPFSTIPPSPSFSTPSFSILYPPSPFSTPPFSILPPFLLPSFLPSSSPFSTLPPSSY